MTPIFARYSTPFLTHSSVSPSPMIILEETRFFLNTFTASRSDARIKSRDWPFLPIQTRSKISGSMVSTLYFTSVTPASLSRCDESFVGDTATPIGTWYFFTACTYFTTRSISFSGVVATPEVKAMTFKVPFFFCPFNNSENLVKSLDLSLELGNRAELAVIAAPLADGYIRLFRAVRDHGINESPYQFLIIFQDDDIPVLLYHLQRGIRIDLQPDPVTP